MIVHLGRKTSEFQCETEFPDNVQCTIMSSLYVRQNQWTAMAKLKQ